MFLKIGDLKIRQLVFFSYLHVVYSLLTEMSYGTYKSMYIGMCVHWLYTCFSYVNLQIDLLPMPIHVGKHGT